MHFKPDHPYLHQFRHCGYNVRIASDVFIEHPEAWSVGDDVTFHRGFTAIDQPREVQIEDKVSFGPNCYIQGTGRLQIASQVDFHPGNYLSLGNLESSFIRIGHTTHFAPNCVLYGWGGLDIGPYCNIAAHVVFATVGHHDEITTRPMALSGEKIGPILLKEDIWIGANCTITANTTIARGCVIAANAVLTKDTAPMTVYAGVPARFLRNRG